MQVNLTEAASQLPDLIRAALAGDEVIIADQRHPPVRLVPMPTTGGERRPGTWSHLPPADEDWDSPEFNREIASALLGKEN